MNIANMIKSKRNELGLTQEELAKKLFISRQAVSNWERGRSYPDITKLKDLSELFCVSMDLLLLEEVEDSRKENRKLKVITSTITIIMISIISILVYRAVYPPHLAAIDSVRGECNYRDVSVRKSIHEYSPGEFVTLYTILTQEQVTFEFGTYCITALNRVKVVDDDFDNATLSVHLWSGGFVPDNYDVDINPIGSNLYFYLHKGINVVENKDIGSYQYTDNTLIEFKVPKEMITDEVIYVEAKIEST